MTKVTIASLQAEHETETRQLRSQIERLTEKLEYADDKAKRADESAKYARQDADRLRTEVDAARVHEREVYRLRGMIEGFERAGKIEPQPMSEYAGDAGIYSQFGKPR